MQNIIQIKKQEIGSTEVNCVNARDVHKYLEVNSKFADWIKRAIVKYDFVENEDYVCILKNEKAGNNAVSKEYIVTLDMAKELCMLENNPKGKETRKYFINFEKKAKEVIENQSSEIQFLQGMLNVLSKMDNRVTKLEETKRLESWQDGAKRNSALCGQKELQDLKNKKVYELVHKYNFKDDKEMARKLHSGVWRFIKDRFNLPRYNELPILKFEEAKSLINSLTLKDLLSA